LGGILGFLGRREKLRLLVKDVEEGCSNGGLKVAPWWPPKVIIYWGGEKG